MDGADVGLLEGRWRRMVEDGVSEWCWKKSNGAGEIAEKGLLAGGFQRGAMYIRVLVLPRGRQGVRRKYRGEKRTWWTATTFKGYMQAIRRAAQAR